MPDHVEQTRRLAGYGPGDAVECTPEGDGMQSQLHPADGKAVTITDVGDEWHVLVEEPGCVTVVRSFNIKQYAESYADGQRIRLQLDSVTRV
ncbi:hypothetical protein [Mesorhizobium sp. WSM3859]|uniref:hypothetical protein n=1 Tax=Mesorhizobium sp. WSM3859 TaxID=2029402 RepID=UPI000BAF933F|nr:hypothetical protein [Mesorhizobium sp. WSM3859]